MSFPTKIVNVFNKQLYHITQIANGDVWVTVADLTGSGILQGIGFWSATHKDDIAFRITVDGVEEINAVIWEQFADAMAKGWIPMYRRYSATLLIEARFTGLDTGEFKALIGIDL